MPFSPLCPGEIREPLLPFAAAFFLSGKEQARRNDWVLSAHGWVDAAGSAEVGGRIIFLKPNRCTLIKEI
jgi:hypothetical protein